LIARRVALILEEGHPIKGSQSQPAMDATPKGLEVRGDDG
jgi:hypothetical protein